MKLVSPPERGALPRAPRARPRLVRRLCVATAISVTAACADPSTGPETDGASSIPSANITSTATPDTTFLEYFKGTCSGRIIEIRARFLSADRRILAAKSLYYYNDFGTVHAPLFFRRIREGSGESIDLELYQKNWIGLLFRLGQRLFRDVDNDDDVVVSYSDCYQVVRLKWRPVTDVVTNVTVTPSPAAVDVGSTVQLTAHPWDVYGNEVGGRSIAWRSVDPSVATVSASGVVTGVSRGTTEVFATVDGVSGGTTVTVGGGIPPAVATVRILNDPVAVQVGRTTSVTAQAYDANGVEITGKSATWAVGNTAVASVSSAGGTVGVVTGRTVGSTTLYATIDGLTDDAAVQVTAPPPTPFTGVTIGGSRSTRAGATCTYFATASGGQEPFDYDWYINGEGLGINTSQIEWTNTGISYSVEVYATERATGTTHFALILVAIDPVAHCLR